MADFPKIDSAGLRGAREEGHRVLYGTPRVSKEDAWIGVDLDGTLAESNPVWDGNRIEAPIPLMVERVKRWLAEGKNVRILTARVARGFDPKAENYIAVSNWTKETFGEYLHVTSEKDPNMIELWDDRAVQVIPNTGLRADGKSG